MPTYKITLVYGVEAKTKAEAVAKLAGTMTRVASVHYSLHDIALAAMEKLTLMTQGMQGDTASDARITAMRVTPRRSLAPPPRNA